MRTAAWASCGDPIGSLDGTSALITGGAGGIGFAAALALARDGAAVTLLGRTRATLERAVARIIDVVGDDAAATLVIGDATKRDDVAAAMRTAASSAGGLAAVVAVVGGSIVRPLLDFDEQTFLAQLHDNVVPAFLAIRAATPYMADRGAGSIVCISSVVARVPYPFLTPYGAAKSGVEGLVRGAALELAPLGVRVNAVRPGPVRTGPATSHLTAGDPAVQRHLAGRPIARVGEPADIAQAIRYLAGPDASWVTGQCFSVDGGTELAGAPDYLRSLVRDPAPLERSS